MNAKVQCCLLRHARQQSRIWESYPWLMYLRGCEKDALLTLEQVMNCGLGPSCSKGGYGSLLGSSPYMVSEVSRSRKNARVSGEAARGALASPFAWLSRDFSRLPRACSQGNQICPYKTAPQSVSRMRLLGWVNLQRGTFQTRMYTFFNNLN